MKPGLASSAAAIRIIATPIGNDHEQRQRMDHDADRGADGEDRVAHAREKARRVRRIVAGDISYAKFSSFDCHIRMTGAGCLSGVSGMVYGAMGPASV